MKIIIVFITGVAFYLVLKGFKIWLKHLLSRYSGLNFISKILLLTEFIIWLGYLFWVTAFLFREKFFYPYLVTALMLIFTGFLSWFLMRDIFAGVIFRISHNLKNGSYICAGDLTGQIKSQHLTYLKLLTDKGHIIIIPYSGIMKETVTELTQTGTVGEQVMSIKVDNKLSKSETESLIRSTILNNPWSNLKEEPIIKFIEEDNVGYLFEITLLSINTKRMKFVRRGLEELLNIKNQN